MSVMDFYKTHYSTSK